MSKDGWELFAFSSSERKMRRLVERARHNQVSERQRVRRDIRCRTRCKVRFEVLERAYEALRVIVQRLAGLSQKSMPWAVP